MILIGLQLRVAPRAGHRPPPLNECTTMTVVGDVTPDDAGFYDIGELTRALNSAPNTRANARAILNVAAQAEDEAVSKGGGGWFSSNLPGQDGRVANAAAIKALRASVDGGADAAITPDWENVKKLTMTAFVDGNSVKAGSATLWSARVNLIKDLTVRAPGTMVDAAAKAGESIKKAAQVIPTWAWYAGGGVAALVALTVGYKIYVAPVVGAVTKVMP